MEQLQDLFKERNIQMPVTEKTKAQQDQNSQGNRMQLRQRKAESLNAPRVPQGHC